jgi:hypothetical protein
VREISQLFNASVLAAERQQLSARAAPPDTGAVVAMSKIVSTQWRKVDGRWHVAGGIQVGMAESASAKSATKIK